MSAVHLLMLLHVLGVLHWLRVPFTAFCMLGRVREVFHGAAYCLPQRALELWAAA